MIYQPSDDSYLLAEQVKLYAKNKKVLDIGTGTGIQALTALKAGASEVLASDINIESKDTLSKQNISFINSDLFNNISNSYDVEVSVKPRTLVRGHFEHPKVPNKSHLLKRGKAQGLFDLIIFNPPYLPEDKREPSSSALSTTGGKKGDEIILKFLKQAKVHLNKNGIILLLLSSLTPKERILSLLNKLNFKYKIIAQKNLFMETLYVWEIKTPQNRKKSIKHSFS